MTETAKLRRTVWSRIYGVATWVLIILFALLAAIHAVMTVLFYLGFLEQGFGYIFSLETHVMLITLLDGSAAFMLWFAYRRGAETPRLSLILTVAASVIMWGRADWMVFVPISIAITIGGAVGPIVIAERSSG